MYGIQASGFIAKDRATILAELQSAARIAFGDVNLDVSQDSFVGIILGVLADSMATSWETAQGVYTEAFAESSTGVNLERVCALSGITRKAATKSQVEVLLGGLGFLVVPAGTVFDSGEGSEQVVLLEDKTLSGGGFGYAMCEAVNTGPLSFPANSIVRIATPVAGLSSVLNELDEWKLGTNIETDQELRKRREISVARLGTSSLQSLRAAVLEVRNVTEAYVYENDTDVVNSDGMTPHSFTVVVRGGEDADIAAAMLSRKPAGIYSYGTSSTIPTPDFAGVMRNMRITRPVASDIYVTVNIETYNQGISDVDLIAKVKAAVVAQESLYKVGNDVIASKFVRPIFEVDSSVYNVASVLIGTSASPSTSTSISINNYGYASFDTSRVVVNVTHLVEA